MTTTTAGAKRMAAAEKRQEEFLRYLKLFATAFDELHDAVIEQIKMPDQYIGAHHDYPVMSRLESGFPSFHESGFYKKDAPRNYTGTVRPNLLVGLLGGLNLRKREYPRGDELASFLRDHEIGERLNLSQFAYEGKFSNFRVENLVSSAVERYLHLHGLQAHVDARRRDAIIRPLALGTIERILDLTLVVPITMTHFELDHFPLTKTSYIARIPQKLQLARARMSTLGSGAAQMVVGAATHAFVSKDWSLEVDSIDEVWRSLNRSTGNILDATDSFFSALRVATGINTGYAQMLWVPRRWALDYYCDLAPVYGTALRRYPSEFDNYGWVRAGATVTVEHLNEVRRIYHAVVSSQSEAMRLALRRLNGCLTRTDAADAILDGTIGLEILLGDDENQALSYKLRLRAAALATLKADPAYPAVDVATRIKRLYKARSAIVHGRRKPRSKTASEPTDTSNAKDRLAASDLLRFVINVLLTNPEYQDSPGKIDDDLLLRSSDVVK